MTTSHQYPIRSLLNLSLHEITKDNNLSSFKDQFWLLPPNLKDLIRTVLLKRGVILHDGIEIMKPLLHSNMRILDLSECLKTEELLVAVLDNCGYLRKLNLNCNRNEDDNQPTDRLSELIKRSRFLSVLSMRNCTSADDSVLLNMSGSLTEIDLGGCVGISDKGISVMVQKCCHLTSLSLNRTLITDFSLSTLGLSSCRATLKELNVSSCVNISDEGIQDFLVGIKMNDNIPVLNILIFHKCPKLTETSRILVDDFFSETNIRAKQISWTIY